MLKRKKTTASGKLAVVKSVRRTRSHRIKFCVPRGIGGGNPQQAAPRVEWLSRGIACQIPSNHVIFPIPASLAETSQRLS